MFITLTSALSRSFIKHIPMLASLVSLQLQCIGSEED